ncbi:MAG: hypothetical protein JOZ43_08945 [Acidobacteriales bacterium]|nr:hypothetical protein [Terriglobales bacterium]
MILSPDNGGHYKLALRSRGVNARCPICASTRVYRSRYRTIREIILRAKLMRPYRCLKCFNRFLDKTSLRNWGNLGQAILVPAPATTRRRSTFR